MPTSDQIKNFARTLFAMPAEERRDHFANAVIEHSGHYGVPRDLPPGRAIVVLSLHGIEATGPLEDVAIDRWICAVLDRKSCVLSPEQVADVLGPLPVHARIERFCAMGGKLWEPMPQAMTWDEVTWSADFGGITATGISRTEAVGAWVKLVADGTARPAQRVA